MGGAADESWMITCGYGEVGGTSFFFLLVNGCVGIMFIDLFSDKWCCAVVFRGNF